MKKFLVFYLALALLVSPLAVYAQNLLPVKVDYALPYPGLLPDNPIYFLKVLRDNVVLWAIRDNDQKAFYLLFLSDKRLAAAQKLVERGKYSLGVETLVQVGRYLNQSVDLGQQLSSEKKKDLFAKLVVAGTKHTQVINDLKAKLADQQLWNKAFADNLDLQNRVMEIYLEPR